MTSGGALRPWICRSCSLSLVTARSTAPRRPRAALSARHQSSHPASLAGKPAQTADAKINDDRTASSPDEAASSRTSSETPPPDSEPGAMARRLEAATEDALTSGPGGQRALSEAGFSDELKARLLDKISAAAFETDHAGALSEAGLSERVHAAAGRGTRETAAAQPWTGTESTEDAVLRMLDDAHKKLPRELRGRPTLPALKPVDMRITGQQRVSAGRKLAGARDKAGVYAGMGLKEKGGLTEEERAAVKKEFRARFAPGAGPMPNSVTGLAELANKRIEDAIARGQFKNIPRGKDVVRDTRADNPFIDTTEYIMNKMIKRQDIVPPWIDKQQELVKAANVFRSRLRNDWRRHAARSIASHGGSLEEQMRRASDYARAEAIHNPRRRNIDEISISTSATDDVVMQRLRQEASSSELAAPPSAPATPPDSTTLDADTVPSAALSETTQPPSPAPSTPRPAPQPSRPFRDPTWEATERSYMTLAVQNLNSLTRSYNLIAPALAKKPYFSLERELAACFADVAPQLAGAIQERAARPARSLVPADAGRLSGVLDRLGGGKDGLLHTATVYESKVPKYGMKEFWRDLWARNAKV